VATAGSGLQALKKVRTWEPDLVLLDLMLPDMDGFAVCEALRQNESTKSLPVILLTGVSGELGRLSGLSCGANEYVTKPFSPKTLVSKLEFLLQKIDNSRAIPSASTTNEGAP